MKSTEKTEKKAIIIKIDEERRHQIKSFCVQKRISMQDYITGLIDKDMAEVESGFWMER